MQPQHTRRVPLRRFHDANPAPDQMQPMRTHSLHGHQPFRPLPAPTGSPPYHLDLASVLQPADMDAITKADRLVFHIVGDTGGVKDPLPQEQVAAQMEADFAQPDTAGRPAFFYHLGDVVYFYGEGQEYFPQFYEPYMHYPAPIFAIPGNHDGDLSKTMEASSVHSLDAFVANFCQRIPYHTRDALDATRHAMTQPNVYFTLETPLITIIGLYTNVPDGGQMDDDQIAWLEGELANAPTDRALMVAMHHPIYSLDDHHGGSAYMNTVLDSAVERSGRVPDLVFAAHVHNYQRFTRDQNGRQVPYLVVGDGGYHNLHRVSHSVVDYPHDPPFALPVDAGVTFETYCDDQYGYLILDVTRTAIQGDFYAVARRGDVGNGHPTHLDRWTLDIKAHKVQTHPTGAAAINAGHTESPKPVRRRARTVQ